MAVVVGYGLRCCIALSAQVAAVGQQLLSLASAAPQVCLHRHTGSCRHPHPGPLRWPVKWSSGVSGIFGAVFCFAWAAGFMKLTS